MAQNVMINKMQGTIIDAYDKSVTIIIKVEFHSEKLIDFNSNRYCNR